MRIRAARTDDAGALADLFAQWSCPQDAEALAERRIPSGHTTAR